MDRVSVNPAAISGAITTDGELAVAVAQNDTQFANIDLAEFIGFDKALTVGQMTQVEDWIDDYWGF